ncbi:MAG: MATE family efflux transporter [Dehalococcoidales bacterium]|nr:MATE family efflux transporter [Dehalococcoidales bacterium]
MKERESSTEKRNVPFRDWTQGSIVNNLWALSWPMIISSILNTLGPTVDMIWVGKLGSASVAGVGLAGLAVQLVNSLLMGLFAGLRAMVARFVGAGDNEGANQAAKQAIVVSAIFSIIMAIIGIFFAKQILGIFGVSADVVGQGAAYLRIQFLGMVAMVFVMMTGSTMQASGDTMTPMKISLIYRLLHVALCPFLVFGWWIFPRMGVSGAALTTVISQSLGGTIGLWILFSGRTRLRLNFRGFRFDTNLIWRIVKVGLPASINSMERSVVGLVMMWFIAPFGTLAVAAHTIMQRVEMVVLMPGMGFGQAAGVLAGQNMGANQPERAEKSGWLGVCMVEAFMIVSSVAIFLWAPGIVRIFNNEAGVVEIGSTFLMIAAVGYFFMGFAAVLSECLNGVGDTVIPMAASLITMWGVQVPLAYFLPRMTDLGVYGVRWAMVVALAMRAFTYIIYFKLGRWKRKKV